MTFSAFVGIALTLAIVLGLLAVTLRVVRRMAIGPASGRGSLRMEVLRRIPLGPRQGIAVVRIGTQTVAVSVGDGGCALGDPGSCAGSSLRTSAKRTRFLQ